MVVSGKKNNPEKVKEQKKRYSERENELSKLRRKEVHEWVNNYKSSKGCAICGYNKCASALDFHHNGDKEFGIARARDILTPFTYDLSKIQKKVHQKQIWGLFYLIERPKIQVLD